MQEFDFKVVDRKGKENLVADHLSRLPPTEDSSKGVVKTFPNERLFAISRSNEEPWFTDIANWLTCNYLAPELTQQ